MKFDHIPKIKVILSIKFIVCFAFVMFLFGGFGQAKFELKQFSYAASCNCTMDQISSNKDNLTGVTLPRISIIKNETLESQTEGPLIWTAVKSAPLMNIITDKFLLGNLTGGTSVTVALNTINVTSKDLLGIQVTGGTSPDAAKVELIKVSSLNENATLKQVKLGEKVLEHPIEPDSSANKVQGKSIINLDIPNSGYYLLLVSISYNPDNTSNVSNAKKLIGVYETLLKVQ
jgi:hypothetical protein